nr:MAG TPA: hypothetical protein [Caudoviricetes sp.]
MQILRTYKTKRKRVGLEPDNFSAFAVALTPALALSYLFQSDNERREPII